MKKLIIRNAAAVVSCDPSRTLYRDADIVIGQGRIIALGEGAARGYTDDAVIIDGHGHFIYPGLINTHHHFFQAFVRNQRALDWSQLTLVQWLQRIYQIFTLIDADCIYQASLVSMAELLKHGCTTAFDHQYCHNRHAGKYLIDRQFEAAHKLGIRFVAGRGANTLPESAGSTIPDSMVESTEDFLEDCERLIDLYHDPDPFSMRSVVVAPCQPVNSYPHTFTEAMGLARDRKVFLHTHLCEGENALMQNKFGKRSLQWCEDIGFIGPDVWLAHGWEMTREELLRMGQHNTGLSHCPAPMCLVGDGVTDLAAAHTAGVRVGMGVDGQASNDNSNLLECIRLSYLLQCLVAKQRSDPMPPPEAFLHYATRGGAELLGRPRLGSLATGQAADFFAVDVTGLELAGAIHDPELLPVRVGFGKPVALTVVNGRVVWQNGEFPGLDEGQLAAEAEATFRRVIEGSSIMRDLRQQAGAEGSARGFMDD